MKTTFITIFLLCVITTAICQTSNKGKGDGRQREIKVDTGKSIRSRKIFDKHTIVIDLSSPATTMNYQVANGEPFKVITINMAPGANYSINNKTTIKPITPLETPQEESLIDKDGKPKHKTDSVTCSDLKHQLDIITNELDFVKLLAKAKNISGCIVIPEYEELSTFNYN